MTSTPQLHELASPGTPPSLALGDLLWSVQLEALLVTAAGRASEWHVWTPHTVVKLTAKRAVVACPDNVWPPQATMSVARAELERDGLALASAIGRPLYTSAGRAAWKAEQTARDLRVDTFMAEVCRRVDAGEWFGDDRDRFIIDERQRRREGVSGRRPSPALSSCEPAPSDPHTWPVEAGAIRRRFRELAVTAHPDHGGEQAAFVALFASYQRALERVGAT
jgi:hypothetical protein